MAIRTSSLSVRTLHAEVKVSCTVFGGTTVKPSRTEHYYYYVSLLQNTEEDMFANANHESSLI